jgi:large subunit ribosomal protein L15
MALKKRKKASRYHGKGMGTSGNGSRKQHRSSGNRGGRGLSGTGKRADHKKTLIQKLYGHGYFGKKGITSVGTKRDQRKRINLRDIEKNIDSYVKKGLAKKNTNGFELTLKGYKILGEGEIKNKLKINAKEASLVAIEKVKKAGGEIVLEKVKSKEKDKKEQVKK